MYSLTSWLLAFIQQLLMYMSSSPVCNQTVFKHSIKVYKTNICEWELCKLMFQGSLDLLLTQLQYCRLWFVPLCWRVKAVWRLQRSVLPEFSLSLCSFEDFCSASEFSVHVLPLVSGLKYKFGRTACAQVSTVCLCWLHNIYFMIPFPYLIVIFFFNRRNCAHYGLIF